MDLFWKSIYSAILIFITLPFWAALVWRCTQRSRLPSGESSNVIAAALLNMGAAFPLLVLWFRTILPSIIAHNIPPAELWLVVLALAWMISPIIVLWLTPLGAKLGASLFRRQ